MTALESSQTRQVVQNSHTTIQMVAVLELTRLAFAASSALWLQQTPQGVVVKCSTGQLLLLPNQVLVRETPSWCFPNVVSGLNPSALGQLGVWLGVPDLAASVIGLAVQQNSSAIWLLEAKHTEAANAMLEQAVRLLRTLDEPNRNSDKDFGRSIAQSIPTPICVTDQAGRIGYINPAFSTLLGFELAQVYLRPLSELVWGGALPSQANATQRFRIQQHSGQYIWVEMCSYPRFDQHHNVLGAVSTLREIGEEMHTQERLEKIETDLRRIQTHVAQGSGFQGRLETCDGVAGLLQMLVTNGSQGAVVLDDSMIFLERGRIVAIQHPKLEGIQAAQHLIRQQHGHFQFFPNVQTDHPTLSLDPMSLILHHAQTFDESQHRGGQDIHEIHLPNAAIAKAFLRGIGERQLQNIEPHLSGVILETPYLRMVIGQASLEDFADLPRVLQ
jgi:PAS domain S-box-containing protein